MKNQRLVVSGAVQIAVHQLRLLIKTTVDAPGRMGVQGTKYALHELLEQFKHQEQVISDLPRAGHVSLVGAGPGDPELLTLKARRVIDDADVIVHDRLVGPMVMELARREATCIEVGKAPGGVGWSQSAINEELVRQAKWGAQVVRLKSGDPTLYGRLDEEIEALDRAGISYDIVPGITSALAACAAAKVSLTRRHRNSTVRIITGQDINGYVDQDWQALATQGSVAAIYMGRAASSFMQGRLLLHGADAATPVTVVEYASRPQQRIVLTTLDQLSDCVASSNLTGPVMVLYGLQSRESSSLTASGYSQYPETEPTALTA